MRERLKQRLARIDIDTRSQYWLPAGSGDCSASSRIHQRSGSSRCICGDAESRGDGGGGSGSPCRRVEPPLVAVRSCVCSSLFVSWSALPSPSDGRVGGGGAQMANMANDTLTLGVVWANENEEEEEDEDEEEGEPQGDRAGKLDDEEDAT